MLCKKFPEATFLSQFLFILPFFCWVGVGMEVLIDMLGDVNVLKV